MNNRPSFKYIRLIIASFMLVFFILIAVSCFFSINNLRSRYMLAAKENARALFTEIVATRSWNAAHGGLYMVVSGDVKANPYLKDRDRDIVSSEGLKLTKINPAYMTRMISEVLKERNSVEFHITSDRPINRNNMADSWELESIRKFTAGEKETFDLEGKDQRFFRYMAPLVTDRSCLRCHEEQGYSEGDIRGGISIRIPFASYAASIGEATRHIFFVHLFFSLAALAITLFLGRMLLKSINALIRSKQEIRVLSGLLPICSSCKKVRDDSGYWSQVENYISEHSEAEFSHSICPDCMKKLYSGQDWFEELVEENPEIFGDSGNENSE